MHGLFIKILPSQTFAPYSNYMQIFEECKYIPCMDTYTYTCILAYVRMLICICMHICIDAWIYVYVRT